MHFFVLISYFLLLGVITGFLAGLLGVGGGMLIVPFLLFLFTHHMALSENIAMHLAVGTSLATVVISTLLAALAHHKRGAILWQVLKTFVPGVVVGALILGPLFATFLSGIQLKSFFAIFCLLMSIQMIFTPRLGKAAPAPHPHFFSLAVLIGTISSILGIAGGSLVTVVLNWYRYPMRNIVATAAAIGLPLSLCGTIGFIITSWHFTGLPKWSSGLIYWPAFIGIVLGSIPTAPLGAAAAHQLPVKHLQKLFAAMLFLVGVHMLLPIFQFYLAHHAIWTLATSNASAEWLPFYDYFYIRLPQINYRFYHST